MEKHKSCMLHAMHESWVLHAVHESWVLHAVHESCMLHAMHESWVLHAMHESWVLHHAWIMSAPCHAWIMSAPCRAWIMHALCRAWIMSARLVRQPGFIWGFSRHLESCLDLSLVDWSCFIFSCSKKRLKLTPSTGTNFSRSRPYFPAKILVWGTKISRTKIPVTASFPEVLQVAESWEQGYRKGRGKVSEVTGTALLLLTWV